MLLPGSDTSADSHQGTDLPTEIFEQILEEVYNYRYTLTLKNCTLVNHFFCSLSQRRLLRSVVIHLEPDVQRNRASLSASPAVCAADEFLEVLRRAPHLQQHIHVFTIMSDMLCPFIRPDTDHWIATHSSLLPLIQTLTNLRSFRVKKGKKAFAGMDRSPPSISQENIFDVLPPSLVEIALDLDNVPFRYFQSCHWIKDLSIQSLDCTLPKRLPSSLRPTIRLQRLELGSIPSDLLIWLSTPECPLETACIESLKVAPRSMPNMTFVEDLGYRMRSVHEIWIDALYFGDTAFARYNTLNYPLAPAGLPLPNLKSFKSLTALRFSAAFSVRTFQRHLLIDYFTNPLAWITDVVSLLPPNQLRVLVLDFCFVSPSDGFPHVVVHLLRLYWHALRIILYEKQSSTKLAISLKGLDHEAVQIVEGHLESMNFDLCIL